MVGTKKTSDRLSYLGEKMESDNVDVFFDWFNKKAENNSFVVNEIPFDHLEEWYFENGTKNFKHSSNRFFSIEGINVSTNFGHKKNWDQPIIVQPEIGILGILTKLENGVRYFLMQAKMEPGNINIVQLSPTLQATRSNFTKVHKGKLPNYFDYFTDRKKAKILIDQLQTEQGGRFLKKRNRNMVIEALGEVEVYDDFIWLTLEQIKKLLCYENIINMDARSVLATIPLIDEEGIFTFNSLLNNRTNRTLELKIGTFTTDIPLSLTDNKKALKRFDEIISWITEMKLKYELHVVRIPLSNVNQWSFSESEIKHEGNKYFSVIAVEVKAGNREVTAWTQPLFKEKNLGLIGFIVTKYNGILHFLIQAKVEPGNFDTIELAPTVSCSNYIEVSSGSSSPPFIGYFTNPDRVLYSTIQSEEGGRFFHFQNRNMIVLIEHGEELNIPENYKWISLGQLMKLMKFGYLNIESRSLISAISITG
jgi:dTDP-4-dehydro-6-deoxy-alpha-D-glucopyranose 2,3-dehydratase